MAKKKKEETKEVSLDDLEEELADVEEDIEEEEEEAEIEDIEEFSLDEISEEEEISEVFEEEIEERAEEEVEEIPEIKEEEIIDERIYVIPLSRARNGPRTKWAKKSVRYLREYMYRHMKPESLVISQDCNERIWARGIKKPPRKIKVRATKNIDGLVVVYTAD